MRSILLHVHNDSCLEARLQVSLDLARAFGGHVSCLQVTPFDFLVPGDFYGTLAAEMVPVLREDAEKLRKELAGRLEREDVAWDWRQEDGPAIDYLLQASAVSDVIVLGATDPAGGGKGPSRLVGEVAIRSRSPVLVVPEAVRSFDAGGTAVVGWNGSIEAAHALKAALPLLQGARSVVIAKVGGEEPRWLEISATEGAEYLSRHGIECEIVALPLEGGSVAQALVRAAAAREATYLVVGAYGHARVVETVFGGVTRELLAAPPLSIFTAH